MLIIVVVVLSSYLFNKEEVIDMEEDCLFVAFASVE